MHLQLVDPGHAALRKAARVALVMTAMNVVGHTVVDDPGFATFSSFGTFALLGFSNFSGPLRLRFELGIGFAVTGAGLVALGTLASGHLVSSAAMMLVAGFALTFAGVFGGYPSAGGKGLILATVLSVMLPGGVAEIGGRVLGWLVAGLVGSVAMVVFWPERPRPRIRLALGDIARQVGDLLDRIDTVTQDEVAEVGNAARSLHQHVDAALSRPGGPRSRDQALLFLLDELTRALAFVRRIVGDGPRAPIAESDRSTLHTSGELFAATADVLHGSRHDSLIHDGIEPLVARLDRLRRAEIDQARSHLDDDGAVSAVVEGADPRGAAAQDATAQVAPEQEAAGRGGGLLERFDVLFPVRMVSYLALSSASNALVAVGRDPGDLTFEFQSAAPALRRGWRDTAHITWSTLRTHFRPASRWFRNAVRVGVALAASAVVADLIHLDHSFWVVLGTLSVLRSGVMDTGASAIESITGTLVGFCVAALVMVTIGEHTAALWVALPIVIFAAVYVADVVNYLVGQAAFTVMIVVMFNLSEQVGWQLGLVRLERVALGVAVSLVAAVMIWPRGATYDLARAVAQEYRTALRDSRAAFTAILGTAPPTGGETQLHHAALAARALAEGELGDLMNSRSSTRLPADVWARLVSLPHGLTLGADWLRRAADQQLRPATAVTSAASVADAATAIDAAGEAVRHALLQGADRLGGAGVGGTVVDRAHVDRAGDDGAGTGPAPSGDGARPDELTAAERSVAAARTAVATMLDDPSWRGVLSDRQVFGVLWAMEWVMYVGDVATRATDDMERATAATGSAWWR